MLYKSGFAVVMSSKPNPREPNAVAMFFGPTTSEEVRFLADNLVSNGFELFKKRREAERASAERGKVFGKEGFHTSLVWLDLCIAEHVDEWEELRSHGSYVVATGDDLHSCHLWGRAEVDGKRVAGAHDTWADFYTNGLRPYTSFTDLVGETSLGTLPELLRQGAGHVWLIGIRMRWELS